MSLAGGRPATFDDASRLADAIIARVGKTIVLALPLGLGKANHVANALYAKAVADRSLRLTIFTALTLEPPRAKRELERRFVDPLVQRVFAGYPALDYATAVHAGTLPPNVEVNEFFFEAGQWLNSPYAQQRYISANYTHALHCVLDRGVNVVAQLVAHRAEESERPYSLSCNPDLTLDLLEMRRAGRVDFLFAGQINSELPFMAGDAAIAASELDMLLDGPGTDFRLFGPPREPIPLADHAAGLHAASLVPDGGTLQIGIGSLGDAVAHALVLRHRKPDGFRAALARLRSEAADDPALHAAPFVRGLYGCSEMFVEAFLDLHRAGVLKREVDGAVLEGGFLLGSRAFYQALREMPPGVRAKFRMRSISFVNQLYGDEAAKRRARVDARFVNAAMMATLLGDVVSDGLEDGRIVSGVGGQYNFVAQGFALEGARSLIMLRASRIARGRTDSNIRWRYGHTTIPRHLRDIIVTEYGVADLRGKPDREVIARMLAITDARFQDELLRAAKDAGKIERTFEVPKAARDNTPEALVRALEPAMESGLLPTFPFGTDFTATEQRLLPALALLKSSSPIALAALLARGMFAASADRECLARLQLAKPRGLAERFYAALVRGALSAHSRDAAAEHRT
ncbi:MAG TPA: acetyl-CoA hydrolase/transferase C-terminal domain-containing protein [Xanthobacteraceae bacterium]|nr:acetyl-CoA hydrolase/transferase C-terminal domain-containing protein [Xanthobacteraceae bacterium]